MKKHLQFQAFTRVLLLTTFASMAFGLDACPYSWFLHENLCYKRLDASATYNNAQASCEAQNANLATIPTNSANDFVRNSVVLNGVNSYWIGLREEDWSTRPWRWETGEVVVYDNWNSGEPNDAGGEEDCTELLTSNGQWNDVPCSLTLSFICSQAKKIFDVVCHPEYMLAKVHSYYYISEGIDLEDLHLSDMSCHGVEDPSSPDMWIFNTTTLSSCSTSLRENSTHFFYSNTINNVRTSGVYHGHPIYNTFSCVYEKDLENVSLFSFSYSVIKNVKNITAPAGLGVFSTEMNVFTDHTHTTLDTRTQYEATDSLFVMMKLGATHPDLTLVIDRCWITATPDLNHESQYVFIENGCPVVENKNDVQITASGVGQSASFESPVFAFINYDTTYLHCSLEICSLAGGSACEPVCGLVKRSFSAHMSRGKRQADSDEDNSEIETLSVGPYIVIRDETNPNPDYVKSNDLTNTTLIAILGAVVIVVVALLVFAGVWKRGRKNVVTTQKMDVVPFSNPAMIKE